MSCNPIAVAVSLIGWRSVPVCRHFSPPLKLLKASQAHPRGWVLLLLPLAHHSRVNGCGLHDWLKHVCIDPVHPAPTESSFEQSDSAWGKSLADHNHQANQKLPPPPGPTALMALAIYIHLSSSVYTVLCAISISNAVCLKLLSEL